MNDTHYLGIRLINSDCYKDIMLTVPARIPAAPIPQIALPTMNDNELGAAPQIAEAASNSPILQRKMVLT